MSLQSRFAVRFVVVLGSWLSVLNGGLQAADPPTPKLSAEIRSVIGWLPPDTETLMVAHRFPMLKPAPDGTIASLPLAGQLDYPRFTRTMILEGLFSLEKGKYLAPLAEKPVSVAIRGSRNYDVVSSFGGVRSEGCAVVIFEKDLGDAGREWTKLLREGAKTVKQMSGRDVFVFDTHFAMEPWVKTKDWQATYLVLLNPKTILQATSDDYLEAVLRNIDSPPAERALPDDLPEWQNVDLTAAAWMIHHVPEKVPERTITGVTFSTSGERLRMIYLPLPEQKEIALEVVRLKWKFPGQKPDQVGVEFEKLANGTVAVSTNANTLRNEYCLANITKIIQTAGEK